MNAAGLVHDYGYFAIVVGTFFEGELIMLAAGMAACAGVVSLPVVILAGMTGIFASDTLCFFIGRLAGTRIERWFPRMYGRLAGVFRMIARHDEKLIVYFQFFPGLCTVTPMAFGISKIPALRFMALDLVGNILWTSVFSFGGYAFGTAFERLVGETYRWQIAASCVLVAVLAFVLWRRRVGAARLASRSE
jgi:membrane protein DedA with SNARE-associated domain